MLSADTCAKCDTVSRITPEMAREAYQSAIPNRREEYRHTVHSVPRDGHYLVTMMRVGKEELRFRLQMAADRVKQMIDSGWSPQGVETVASIYRDMFMLYNSANRNSFDDLYHAINSALDNVGVANKVERQRLYSLEFGQYQVDVSTEFTHDLEFYMAAKQPKSQNVTNLTLQGNINYLQTGGTSTVNQHIGLDASEVTRLLQSLKDAVGSSEEQFKDAIVDLVDRGIDQAKKPNVRWAAVANTLDGLQNLIRTTGAVPASYNFVAGLFASHGIHLPALPSP